METLYQKSRIISRVKKYFTAYIELLTKPSGQKLFMVLLAVMTMQTVTSIQHIYKWFLAGLSKISQNSYYYLLNTEMKLDRFAAVTIQKAILLTDENCKRLPVLLLLDDTLQEKYGAKFECYSTMFDHAYHNGSQYLEGHCFVALTICVPVFISNVVHYMNVPVRFRLRKEESKLKIASEMIGDAMKVLKDIPTVILLCDSWYPKGEVLDTVKTYENLELIANVRVDTSIYNLPVHTGKRGRPPKKGKKLSIYTDFTFTLVGDYFTAARTVLTNLFEQIIYVTVTTPNLTNHDAYRLFVSTISPEKLNALFADYENLLSDSENRQAWLFPLYLYRFRWNIEVMFYELKNFWSFGNYMLRSKISSISFLFPMLLPKFFLSLILLLLLWQIPVLKLSNMLLATVFAKIYFSLISSPNSKTMLFLLNFAIYSTILTSSIFLLRLFL